MAEKKGSSSEKTLYCSFCGKSQHEVKKLIAGPSVFICDECIDLCNEVIRDELPAGEAGRETKTDLPMPDWLRGALRYAPLAALVAIVVPETVLTQGQLIQTWQDPRLFAAAAGLAWYMLRKGILGTIVCGTAVLLVLRLGLGWT